MSLHDEIMRIPCDPKRSPCRGVSAELAYKSGHRDARHAAAELAAASEQPAAQEPITEHDAYQIGAKGAEPTECERLLFEAWMRGHCWKVCGEWDGKTYVSASEDGMHVDHSAMLTRQLWAAWRDRAALSAKKPAAPSSQPSSATP